ncbi:rare lipoprotein A precursor [Vibrio maritimus]|uniref:Rare lipoprotein A n=1 Tax=Vibrio maritimus TaxID=990268 RepID=A0A090T678_9VIBR|nr:rare lipoprotein A precursor [Vibrio maritimus]
MNNIVHSNNMKKIPLALSAFLLVVMTGCSSTASIDSQKTTRYAKSHELVGQASWYGSKYHGKRTASGERYNMRRILPLTKLCRLALLSE